MKPHPVYDLTDRLVEPYPFSHTELQRLHIYRLAIRAGFFTDYEDAQDTPPE